MPKKRRDTTEAIYELCTRLPASEAVSSHGMTNYRVRGKTFAMYALNHHGDGRIALWLNLPAGAQALYVHEEPRNYFVPPYVGPRGWLGVRLDLGLAWSHVTRLVREAYEHVAPLQLAQQIGSVRVPPPAVRITIESIDPFASKRGLAVLAAVRKICLALPESSEATQFGSPVWKVGKKVFARLRARDRQFGLAFWVGREQQSLFTRDPLFSVPPYIGPNGWIELDVTAHSRWRHVEGLILQSYRHYAPRRVLRTLPLT